MGEANRGNGGAGPSEAGVAPPLTVLLAGGTGLVGSRVADRLRRRPGIELVSLVRSARAPGDRQIDFEALVAAPFETLGQGRINVGISCLGTTIRAAGSQSAFRRVDHDYVVALAQAARQAGARQFIVVSSVGAGGGSFYLRVKGEMEAGLRGLGFDRLDIIRPGLLIGDRAERRPVEQLAQRVAPLLDPLLLGSLARYGSIAADAVAGAIVSLVGREEPGVHIAHKGELLTLRS